MSRTSLRANATAKINLFLSVLGRRSDGFHDIRSLAIGVGLEDDLVCSLGSSTGVEVDTNAALLQGPDNLAAVAARVLAQESGIEPTVRIKLTKRIPIGGGLGGGSSDAATTLKLCDRLWRCGFGDDRLEVLGATIGSDVPLFFHLPCAKMEGRGERIWRQDLAWSGWAVLIDTGVSVSTARVYGEWRCKESNPKEGDLTARVVEAETADELMELACNDLEPGVFRVSPQVKFVHQELERSGMGPLRVSGAGGVLFRLMDDLETARRLSGEVEALLDNVTTWVVPAPVASNEIELISEER